MLTLQKLLVQMQAPVNSMATPADLNFLASVTDVQVNDAVWALLDAKNALPHDALNLVLDMGMLARWNIFDAATTKDFKPEAITLRQLDVNVAGVTATFSGHGTTDPAGSKDMPFTTGMLDGRVSGLNRLLNAVVASGLMSTGDMFPVRAATAMVFNSEAGTDVQTTHVEARDGGSIFVNGVQLR